MVFDHLMLQLYYTNRTFSNFYEVPMGFFIHPQAMAAAYVYWSVRKAVRIAVVSVFLLSVGINCRFTRSNGIRALEVGIMAVIISLASYISNPFLGLGVISFGMLHLVCASILMVMLVKATGDNKYVYLILGGLIVLGGILISWMDVPRVAPKLDNMFWIILGALKSGPDHFGIFPCAGMVLIGVYVGKVFYPDKKSLFPKANGDWNKNVCFIGKKAFWFYIAHPVAIILLLVIIGYATGYTL